MPRGQLRNRLSLEETNHAVGMLKSGVSQRRIVGILILSLSMITRMRIVIKPSHRHGGGRYRATTQRQDRFY